MASLPPDIKEKLAKVKEATESLRSVHYDVSGGREQLRGAVKVLSSQVTDIDSEGWNILPLLYILLISMPVDRHLKRHTLPSPLSTFLMSSRDLAAVRDNTVRSAMVTRIMRYVSFQPWGSPRAEGNRRRHSIQRIVDNVCTPNPHEAGCTHFVAGGGVLWRPVVISRDVEGKETISVPHKLSSTQPSRYDKFGWLASRQPPVFKSKNVTEKDLNVDLSPTICRALKQLRGGTRKTSEGPLDISYDCRFLLRFDVAKMPLNIQISLDMGRSKLLVEPLTRWYWPRITWQKEGCLPEYLATVADEQQDGSNGALQLFKPSDWIRIYWIRTIEAI